MKKIIHSFLTPLIKSYKIPFLGVITSALLIIIQLFIYLASRYINKNMKAKDLTLSFDDYVPIIPQFSLIYIGAYLFWAIAPIIGSRTNRLHYLNYVMSVIIGLNIGGFIYIIFPTTRNHHYQIKKQTIFQKLLQFVYDHDFQENKTNYFPSFHCMVSIYCYLLVAGREEIPIWYRKASLLSAVLICISTQVTKQHYILDFISSLIISITTFYVSSRFNFGYILQQSLFCKIKQQQINTEFYLENDLNRQKQ